MSVLSEIISTASSKPGYSMRVDTEETVRRITPEPQADMRRLSLRSLQVADVINAGPDEVLPAPQNPGVKTRVATDVIELNSRAVAAGAHVVLIADATQPIQDSAGKIAFVERPGGFIYAEPAGFALVADGAAITDSALPVARALMDRSVAPTYAFRTVLTRTQQKSWFHGELEDGVLLSIMKGLGVMVDAVLLAAIAATTPPAFSLAAVAARGLRYDELRGIVGTSGTGAFIDASGQLVAMPFNVTGWAGGIEAELSPSIAETIVGDFSRAAVGLFEDVTLIGQRASTDGAMTVTCLCNAEALLPVSGQFWTVA